MECLDKSIDTDECMNAESNKISENKTPDVSSSVSCSIRAIQIENFTLKYFMGDVLNSMCKSYDDDYHDDPFSSFPPDGMPLSLASHWNPYPPSLGIQSQSSSFKCHVVDQYEDGIMQKELNMWKEVFKKNLEDMLSKLDKAFTNMEEKMDEAIGAN